LKFAVRCCFQVTLFDHLVQVTKVVEKKSVLTCALKCGGKFVLGLLRKGTFMLSVLFIEHRKRVHKTIIGASIFMMIDLSCGCAGSVIFQDFPKGNQTNALTLYTRQAREVNCMPRFTLQQ
jgi:hypothetical protein